MISSSCNFWFRFWFSGCLYRSGNVRPARKARSRHPRRLWNGRGQDHAEGFREEHVYQKTVEVNNKEKIEIGTLSVWWHCQPFQYNFILDNKKKNTLFFRIIISFFTLFYSRNLNSESSNRLELTWRVLTPFQVLDSIETLITN